MHERRFSGDPERLRTPQRMALLEVGVVVESSLERLSARSVLDVGTGTGIFAEAFAGRSLSVTGIDPDSKLLAIARGYAPGASFKTGTAESLPFPDGSFDLVFLGHVLHETDNPDAALSEARRVALQRVAILEWPYKDEDRGPPRAHRLEPSRILAMAAEAGFAGAERIQMKHMDFYRLTP
jgi:ubiquinone/menaquinone biosynthesis C-methylase UbiE